MHSRTELKLQSFQRVRVDGTPVDIATAKDSAGWVLERIRRDIQTTEAGVNASFVVMASGDDDYKKALEEFDLLLVDGFWAAVAASLLHRRRVYHTNTGPFMEELFRQSGPDGLEVFLLGARPEVVEKAAENMKSFHPNAHVVGFHDGYFSLEEEPAIVKQINKSGASVLLVGITSPKKELFVRRYCDELNVLLTVGVGGFFDIWAGQTTEAPRWVRRWGLEWLYRFAQEPRRMWHRYTVVNMKFLGLVLKQAVRGEKKR